MLPGQNNNRCLYGEVRAKHVVSRYFLALREVFLDNFNPETEGQVLPTWCWEDAPGGWWMPENQAVPSFGLSGLACG